MEEQLATIHVGSKVWFAGEVRPYTVRARNGRYIICTKPFNLKRTVLYTILDLREWVRGPDNLIFGMGYETPEQIAVNMDMLSRGEIEVSHRSRIPLDVIRLST